MFFVDVSILYSETQCLSENGQRGFLRSQNIFSDRHCAVAGA
ncbi:hypothetical protein HMPREF9370_0036 [Neisseria wadsworthii 9715]|uniref:Uncharacterized protein n=1 Tax=Neisseria wadsworthii 9715 TaxID=1030841 RepID=G4CLS7_9NEIS|nr:hypothetical protein HMPREF9370_0036 [Neisseria wadsworthii 9715]